jgi:hypothetical protein
MRAPPAAALDFFALLIALQSPAVDGNSMQRALTVKQQIL